MKATNPIAKTSAASLRREVVDTIKATGLPVTAAGKVAELLAMELGEEAGNAGAKTLANRKVLAFVRRLAEAKKAALETASAGRAMGA